jgi:hypothetical protein
MDVTNLKNLIPEHAKAVALESHTATAGARAAA